jgi:hypothetical protein
MDSTTASTIEKIQAQIDILEDQIHKKKEAINILYELEGEPIRYPDVGEDRAKPLAAFRSDQFFGRPMATAAREILEQRGARNLGAISLDELYDAMKAGGYDFENKNDQIAKRNLAITLAKNPAFTRVPANGFIGLTQWYPNMKKKKDAKNQENGAEADQPDK